MRFQSLDIPAIFAEGRTIVELKTATRAFDRSPGPRGMTAICAKGTAGVDVHRTFVDEPLTVLFGSGRTPSKGSGFVRHKPARRRSVNPCLGGELAGRLLQTVFEAVQRPIERARQPVVAHRV
jgi:hypothetical protein